MKRVGIDKLISGMRRGEYAGTVVVVQANILMDLLFLFYRQPKPCQPPPPPPLPKGAVSEVYNIEQRTLLKSISMTQRRQNGVGGCVIICLTSLSFILFVKDLLLMVNVVENRLGGK